MEASIIIPTRNRSRYLASLLASLVELDFPRDSYEILVVDNGSTDDTRTVAEQFIAARSSPRARYIFEPVPGQLAGRHRGAREAQGKLLVFTDDDIEADRGWLSAVSQTFRDESVHLVGGRNLPHYETPPPDWIQSFWHTCEYSRYMRDCGFLSLLDLGDCALQINPRFVWGLNFAIRKQTLLDLGGFHPDVMPEHLLRYSGNGERGLSIKVDQKGLKAIYQPNALVFHVVPGSRLTIEYFVRRAFSQGVKDSFAEIRAGGGVTGAHRDGRAFLSGFRRFVGRLILRRHLDQIDRIRERISNAHDAGYEFHQKEVRDDPELLKWVLKKDYWDYRLPDRTSSRESSLP